MAESLRRLTVHVLDTARGLPAASLALSLSRNGEVLARRVTNADGRCDGALLEGDALRDGIYEITFDVAEWSGDATGFYDRITLRFRVDASTTHLHIPLLLSPFGYTTYRGS
jgi:5-hydroxyisourate hydrolase